MLAGHAPQLARHYPSAGGREPPESAWQAFRDVLEAHPEEVGAALARPCQTNEAGRCAALLPGFLAIAREHGPALRILELGASAGLNLNWDRYRYEGDGWAWGPPRARLRIAGVSDRMPGHDPDVRVVERAGCDTAPLDPADEDTRLTLRAAIWPERVDRLNDAASIEDGTKALADRLAERADRSCTRAADQKARVPVAAIADDVPPVSSGDLDDDPVAVGVVARCEHGQHVAPYDHVEVLAEDGEELGSEAVGLDRHRTHPSCSCSPGGGGGR